MTYRTLVLGGARSGKSAHAEGLLPGTQPVSYLATAQRDPTDAEWTARIAAHVARRPPLWRTTEVRRGAELPEFLIAATRNDPAILVDDLATWLTRVLDECSAWDGGAANLDLAGQRSDALVAAVAGCPARVVLVSAEVGLGVVPQTSSGRLFRDSLGALNARLADVCDEALLLVAGIPVPLKTFRR